MKAGAIFLEEEPAKKLHRKSFTASLLYADDDVFLASSDCKLRQFAA